jgi:hypothetical protein
MVTNIKKLKSFIKNHKEEEAKKEERKNQNSINFYQNKVGKNALFLCPPHENMEGLPFVLRGKHRNCGPEGKTDFMCASCDGKNLKACPQCVEVRELYDTGRERDKKKASKIRRNQRFYWQVIDTSPILEVEKDEKIIIPDCLLDFPAEEDTKKRKERGCKTCSWAESCEGGVRAWSIGKKIQEPILDELDDLLDDEDVTNPKVGRPIFLRRKGEDATTTEYSGIKFMRPISFPKEVVDRIYGQLNDLSQVSIPKEPDKIRDLMTGVQTEDAEGATEGDDIPKCFGKYDEDEDECLKCDFCEPCEVESKGISSSKPKANEEIDDDDNDLAPAHEDPDPETNTDSDLEDDELENQLKNLARKRQAERQAAKNNRTPAPKPDEDDD